MLPPDLTVHPFPRPKASIRAAERVATVNLSAPSEDLREAAASLLRSSEAKAGRVASPRRLVWPLVELVASRRLSADEHAVAVRLVATAPNARLAHLWALWELVPDLGVVAALARKIRQTLAQRTGEQRVPWWVRQVGSDLDTVLESPTALVVRLAVYERVPLPSLASRFSLSPSAPRTLEVVHALLRNAPGSYLSLCTVAELREWGAAADVSVRSALADRLLRDRGALVVPHGQHEEDAVLVSWVLGALGAPESRPKHWQWVSSAPREVFEDLLVALELTRIFAEFRKHSDDDRARFWESVSNRARDARFVAARESAVCLMLFGNRLFVEFGDVGNACYVYEPVGALPRLRTLKLPNRLSVSDFKTSSNGGLIHLGNVTLRRVNKMTHYRDVWPDRFAHYLYTETA